MARPAAAAPTSLSTSLVGAGASVLALLLLAALIAWPLGEVLVHGAPSLFAELAVIAGISLMIAGGATLGALGMAAVVACAVRFAVPGRESLVAVHRVGVFVPPFVVPLAVLVLVGHERLYDASAGATAVPLAAIALAQAFAYLPQAVALLLHALAAVPPETEQAAELLGASPATVLRRITLQLARSGLTTAALVVLGLCLADVASPLLLGVSGPVTAGVSTLAGFIVVSARWTDSAAAAALALSAATLAVALAARSWQYSTVALASPRVPPAGLRPTATMRAALAALAWLVTAALVALWAVVPITSLVNGGWPVALDPRNEVLSAVRPLANSVALGVGVALAGTTLAVAVAWVAQGRRGGSAAVLTAMARVPVAVPGVVGGLGYLLTFGMAPARLLVIVLCVAAWELPLMARLAGNVVARSERSREQAALSLGARPFTTWRRVVLPTLTPAIAWLLCHGFAIGVTALNAVALLASGEQGVPLGIRRMLMFASAGSVSSVGLGAACAVATVLLALAGGATLLGRAVAGRESIPTLLA